VINSFDLTKKPAASAGFFLCLDPEEMGSISKVVENLLTANCHSETASVEESP